MCIDVDIFYTMSSTSKEPLDRYKLDIIDEVEANFASIFSVGESPGTDFNNPPPSAKKYFTLTFLYPRDFRHPFVISFGTRAHS